jgi:aminopeptidase N
MAAMGFPGAGGAKVAVADLTRAQAQERSGLLAVETYEIELDFTRGGEVFGSTSVIRFTAGQVGASTFVDLIADRVHEARLNGEPVDVAARYADGRLALDNLAADNTLTIVADCSYTNEGTGLHRAVDPVDGKVYVYTKFEPAHARKVFANFDQPDLKAAFAFTVIAPEHWLVLSNEAAAPPDAVREGVARWRFPATPRLPIYVTAVVAGEYAYVGHTFETRRGQVVPLGLACRASLAGSLEPEDVFEITGQGLDFFTDLFDMDFPFAKYDQIFVPEFSSGATENAGCVTITEDFLFSSKVTSLMYQVRAMVVLHEMAHMWFGDYVTMRWWGDLWLNESFAEFCGTFVSAEATRFTEAWTAFSTGRKVWGYAQDQLPSTHPVVADAPTLAAAMANFDGISYAKGASVLKQLVAYVGRKEFFTGVREYFAAHAWDNAEFGDLLAALERASGKDLKDWSAAWLETAGPNTLRAEFQADETGRFTAFAVRQQAPEKYPTLRPHHIAVGFYDKIDRDGVLQRTHRVEVDVSGELTDVPGLVGRLRPDVILLNDDDLGYAITRFDPESLAVLTDSIGTFERSLTRAVCWTAAMDMVQQADMSVPAFVRMLATGMRTETSVGLLQILQVLTRMEVRPLADPRWLPTGLADLAEAGVELLAAAEPGGDFQLAWVQQLGWAATTVGQLDLVEGLIEGTVELPGLVVDTELRWMLLRRLVVTGRWGEERIDAELARDATDAGTRRAQAARAALPDPEHKAAAWALLTETRELGIQGIYAVAGGFVEPEHAALLTPYTRKYFEYLPVLWSTRSERVRVVLAEALFPYACAGEELLETADAFLADRDLDPSLRRVVVEGVDRVRRILRSRDLR